MFSFNPEKVNYDEELGSGAHGTVFAYRNKHADDHTYVVKRITTFKSEEMISSVQEIVLGFSCDHPSVLPIKGYHLSYNKEESFWEIFIKMPRMQTSLKLKIEEYIREGKIFKEEDIVKYFYSLTLGLKYLHGRHIVHRDIKPGNILIDKHDNLKIADVGIAKLIEDETTEQLTRALGTPLYTAPEVLTHAHKLKKRDLFMADIWSLGVIMAELCVPKTRLINTKATGNANESMLAEILIGLQDRYDKVLLELISSLLRADPRERKSLEEVQKILEDKYPNIVAHEAKNKDHKAEEENEVLKSRLFDLQKQVEDLQNQLETLRLSAFSSHRHFASIANQGPKFEEEKKLEKTQSKTAFFKGNCLKTLEGHSDAIFCLTMVTPSILASGSGDHTIKFWDIKTGACLQTLQGHTDDVLCLQTLSSNQLASGSADKNIKIWDIKTGVCLQTLQGHKDKVLCLEILPGDQLVSGSDDQTLKIWNVKDYFCIITWKMDKGSVVYLKFLPMRSQLASGHSYKNGIKLWDLNTSTCLRTLAGHKDGVYCIQMLSSGELASASYDKTIKIWDLDTGSCLKTLEGHSASVWFLELLPTGQLVSSSEDDMIKIWDAKTGQCINSLQAHKDQVLCLQVLPSGELASGSGDQTIKLWN